MTLETTDLERRVLAHERILQALVAVIDETEPTFMARLKATLADGRGPGAGEHNFIVAEQHAERLIREVEARGERRKSASADQARVDGPNTEAESVPSSSRSRSPID
jgi:hypothetical protein